MSRTKGAKNVTQIEARDQYEGQHEADLPNLTPEELKKLEQIGMLNAKDLKRLHLFYKKISWMGRGFVAQDKMLSVLKQLAGF